MKLIILDRDGTINEDRDDYVKSPDEWVPIPGALEAIARLNHAGWHTVVATNQSGLARGLFDMATLNADPRQDEPGAREGRRPHRCGVLLPARPDEGCRCSKPLPGLFEMIGERYGVELNEMPLVGDSLRDLQAGVAAGCPPHLVRTGKGARARRGAAGAILDQVPGTHVHADLAAFAAAPDPARAQGARRAAPRPTPAS